MDGFNDKQKKELIELAINKEKQNKSLSEIFKDFGMKYNRAAGSVRNYYYSLLAESKKDKKLASKLNIPEKLMPAFIEEFSLDLSKEILRKVFLGINEGISIRRKIVEMSNGNEKLMLRYQNKYRNLIKNNKELVLEVVEEIKEKYGKCFNPYNKIQTDKDKSILKLKNEINSMISKLLEPYKFESDQLRMKIGKLERENEKLRLIMKKNIKDKNITKDYFSKFMIDNEAK